MPPALSEGAISRAASVDPRPNAWLVHVTVRGRVLGHRDVGKPVLHQGRRQVERGFVDLPRGGEHVVYQPRDRPVGRMNDHRHGRHGETPRCKPDQGEEETGRYVAPPAWEAPVGKIEL